MLTIAQAEAFASKLIENEFLTTKGKSVLLDQIQKGAIEVEHPSTVKSISYTSTKLTKETILQFCTAALLTELANRLKGKGMMVDDKILHKEPIGDFSGRTYHTIDFWGAEKKYAGCISSKTSVIGYTRLKTLNTFLTAGIIDEKIFNETNTALQSNKIRDEIALLKFMLYRSTHYTYYDFNKKEQVEYIGVLAKNGILSEEEKENLLRSYVGGELKAIPEMLEFSSRYVHVDLRGYEPDPTKMYPAIFERLQKLLPEFRYSNLKVQIVEEKEGGLIRQDIKLSFIADSTRYVNTFYHDYRNADSTEENPGSQLPGVDQDFHKGINKWLSDIESPFRLYTLNTQGQGENGYSQMRVGLLLLKKGEDSLITREASLMSQESFDERLTRKNIDKMIEEFRLVGFFDHLTPGEIQDAKDKVESADINSIENVLICFPKLIVVFDWETGNLENPYEQLTKEMTAASRGGFNATDIIDDYKKGWQKAKQVKYGFTINGKRYEEMLNFNGDWLDPKFLSLIRRALLENNIDGQFHYSIDNGQESGYMFLTANQLKFVSEFYPDLLKDDVDKP